MSDKDTVFMEREGYFSRFIGKRSFLRPNFIGKTQFLFCNSVKIKLFTNSRLHLKICMLLKQKNLSFFHSISFFFSIFAIGLASASLYIIERSVMLVL